MIVMHTIIILLTTTVVQHFGGVECEKINHILWIAHQDASVRLGEMLL